MAWEFMKQDVVSVGPWSYEDNGKSIEWEPARSCLLRHCGTLESNLGKRNIGLSLTILVDLFLEDGHRIDADNLQTALLLKLNGKEIS